MGDLIKKGVEVAGALNDCSARHDALVKAWPTK
jgi:hypothetical protein